MFHLRTGGHQLEITTGKWNNVDHTQRLCQDCNTQQIGDEYHLFTCPTMEELTNVQGIGLPPTNVFSG